MTKCLLEQPMAEQPTEEVQLTELRPVEQSRMTVADSYGQSADTDGLRALRSLTIKQRDEFEHFGARYPRKRKAERWRHLEMGLRDEAYEEEEEEKAAKGMATIAGMTEPMSDGDVDDEDDEYVNGDFEYLEERYDFQQRDEQCSSPEIEGAAVESVKSLAEPVQERAAVESVQCLPEPVQTKKIANAKKVKKGKPGRPRGRPRKKKSIAKTLKSSKSSAKNAKPATETETELRSKINDIIEANYRMEQENNNVVEAGEPASQPDTPGSPPKTPAAEKKHRCSICDAQFKGSGGLRNHCKVMHSDGPGYECDHCGKRFPLKERLKLHMRTHTGFKPYECKTCRKSFARGGQLVQHERTHSKEKPFSCHLCTGTFTCAANLALHLKRHAGQKDHKCQSCGRAFIRRDALKKHFESIHRDIKTFHCHICKKQFKGHLPQHLRTHRQDRPYGCDFCDHRFAQKSQLTVHQRIHSGQRPFRCLVCWQAFAHSTALKLHTRRHTGERPFKCLECKSGFTQLPHWKKHMKCIHGREAPYGCAWCNLHFRIKNELENHRKDCPKQPADWDSGCSSDGQSGPPAGANFRAMSVERMRLLLAVLLKRISKQERLDELGFGKRLIDELLVDSLIAAGKEPVRADEDEAEPESLRENLKLFLEWTVPEEHWRVFQRDQKSPEDILEALTLP